MNLTEIFCPNIECPAKGQTGQGNISVHSEKEKRCYCNVCQTTFSVSKGTIFYRLKTEPGQGDAGDRLAGLWLSVAGDRDGLWVG